MPGKPTHEPLDRLTQEEVQHCKDNQQVEAFFPCRVRKCTGLHAQPTLKQEGLSLETEKSI